MAVQRHREKDEAPLVITDDMLVTEKPQAPQEQRLYFEKNMSYFPIISIALIVVNALVFSWELSTDALASTESIIDAGALYQANVLAGEYWRLVSAMFLHADLEHLAANCIMLYILGLACEHAFSRGQMLGLYFMSGISGSILSVSLLTGPSIGASGAVFGMMGATIAFFYKYKKQLVLRDNRIGFVLLILAIYQIGTGFTTPYIDNFAHLGGLIGGSIVALSFNSPLIKNATGK